MQIFNYNPAILDLDSYFNSIMEAPQIDGIFINVILNVEFDLKVYLPDINSSIDFNEFLDKFKNSNKIIIINMLLGYQLLTDASALDIANFNRVFVDKVYQTIGKYPNTFYLSAISTSTLYFLRQKPKIYKIGTIITRADLGFVDVDFYIFSQYFINVDFMNELLKRNKQIMAFTSTTNYISQLPENIRNQLSYIIQTPSSQV